MESVRALSQKLNPSPVDRLGLERALLRYSEREPRVEVDYVATARLTRETATLLYATILSVIDVALRAKAKRGRVTVSGGSGIEVRVEDDGRTAGRKRALALTMLLAQAAGATISVTTRKSTIVLIRHANRRTTGR